MRGVLVIGSVHLDIVAHFKSDTADNIDKIGSLRYRVGGSAFNIAANLAFDKQPVRLLSIVKSDSLSGLMIRDVLRASDSLDSTSRRIETPQSLPSGCPMAPLCLIIVVYSDTGRAWATGLSQVSVGRGLSMAQGSRCGSGLKRRALLGFPAAG
jgi:hypothetical protein